MAGEARPSVFTDERQRTMEEGGFGVRGTRVGALAGAHRLINRGDRIVRFLVLSSKAIAYMLATEPELGYFEGEPD